jgi:hypothetical protein
MKHYSKFQASICLRLFVFYLPECCQSAKTRMTVKLIKKFKDRIEKSLDVRKIIENDIELKLLLKILLSDKRYFLFKH